MSLIIYNGSPRGEKSNSSLITQWFLEGYGSDNTKIRFLQKFKQHSNYAEEMINYDQVLMVLPLYVDGMPGQVKNFFEILHSLKNKLRNKQISFIIHSGFSDGIQNRVLEQYLNRFSNIMDLSNHGVIIIPGSEGFRHMPPSMTKQKRLAVSRLGAQYKLSEKYNDQDMEYLFGQENTSKFKIFIYRIMSVFGIQNMWWNSQLKKNNAFKKRFDAPYENKPTPITTKAHISNK